MKIDFTDLTSGALSNTAAAHLLNMPLTHVKYDNLDTGRIYVATTQLLHRPIMLDFDTALSLPKSDWKRIACDIVEHFEDADFVNEDWPTAAYQGIQRVEYMNLVTLIEERLANHYQR